MVPTPSEPADEEEAAEEEEQAEEEELAEEDAETDATTADAMAFRSVPSHFYPEAKSKSAAWCGTHKRFEEGEDAAEPAPVSEEMKEAIDELGEVSDAAVCMLLLARAACRCPRALCLHDVLLPSCQCDAPHPRSSSLPPLHFLHSYSAISILASRAQLARVRRRRRPAAG